MKKQRFIGVLLAAALVFPMLYSVPAVKTYAAQEDNWAAGQIAVTEPNEPAADSAYVIFSETAEMSGMKYLPPDGAGRRDELYSEQVVWNGVQSRQVYVENYLYFKVDEDFADESDRVFSLTFDYWDYGGGGYFYVEYLPIDANENASVRILKLGLDENNQKTAGTWFRVTIYIDDAQFTGRMDHGADFRIRSGAYNSFSKVEVRNLSRNAKPDEKYGVFNRVKANSLYELGMLDGYGEGEEFNPDLEKELTREEAIVQLIKSYNLGEEAIAQDNKPSFTDVSAEAAPYVGLAQSMGIIDNSGAKLGANETFPLKELAAWYLRLLGIEGENLEENSVDLAVEHGLISSGSMIFQPDSAVTLDMFVVFAVNVFAMDNAKTGKNPFTELFEQGVYTTQTIADVDDEGIWSWLMQTEFKIPKITHVDELSGRTYYSMGFLGQNAIKYYYTQNCMSMDNKRFYFGTNDYKMFEYNIETEMCRYIGTTLRDYCHMVTPLDNLWYLNEKGHIMKVDLDTYEQTYMGELPPGQVRRPPSMLQINNDESKISFSLYPIDGSIDINLYSPMAVFDVATATWDLSHVYGHATAQYSPNHHCINPNPDYDNLIFFAHEGFSSDARTGKQTPQFDRVWMADLDKDEYFNAFVQKWYVQPKNGDVTTGYTGEGSVHEAWSADGEWLMLVKNRNALDGLQRQIGPGRAVIQRWDGSEKRYIPADFSYTYDTSGQTQGTVHCMMSWDNRWMATDTTYSSSNGWSDLYIYDNLTAETTHLGRICQTGANPGHIHPQFSPNDKMVLFGLWSDDKTHTQVGWMDVSDITENPTPGGDYDISESCKSFSYEGLDFYFEPVYDDGGEISGYEIPAGKQMYVDVKKDIIESDNTPAQVTITYKDDTTLPIKFSYYTWNVNSNNDRNMLAEHVLYIERKGTGKTLTKTYNFDDICLGNMEILGTDFRIGAVGADATIISVDVSVPDRKG